MKTATIHYRVGKKIILSIIKSQKTALKFYQYYYYLRDFEIRKMTRKNAICIQLPIYKIYA